MKTKKFQRNMKKIWDGSKKEIEKINCSKKIEYGKFFFKIRFKSNDCLPLNKPRSIFSEDDKFYPQSYF